MNQFTWTGADPGCLQTKVYKVYKDGVLQSSPPAHLLDQNSGDIYGANVCTDSTPGCYVSDIGFYKYTLQGTLPNGEYGRTTLFFYVTSTSADTSCTNSPNYDMTFNTLPTFSPTLTNLWYVVGGSTVNYVLPSTVDVDDDVVKVKITSTLPGNIAYTSSIMTFTINPSTLGTTKVDIQLSDSIGTVTFSFNIVVSNPNTPPVFGTVITSTITYTIGDPPTIIDFQVSDSDSSDTVTVYAKQDISGSIVTAPSCFYIMDTDDLYVETNSVADALLYNLKIYATDGKDTVVQDVTVRINQAPIITNTVMSIQYAVNQPEMSYPFTVTDGDGDTLIYSIEMSNGDPLDSSLFTFDSSTPQLKIYTNDLGLILTYSIRFKAEDPYSQANMDLFVEIIDDSAPPLFSTSFSDQFVKMNGGSLTYTFPTITYDYLGQQANTIIDVHLVGTTSLPSFMTLLGSIAVGDSRLQMIAVTSTGPGPYDVEVVITDTATGKSTVDGFKVTVNQGPSSVSTLPNYTVAVGTGNAYTLPSASDPENNIPITRTMYETSTGTLPSWISFADGSGTLVITPTSGVGVTYKFSVKLKDSIGAYRIEFFTVTVNSATNTAPYFSGFPTGATLHSLISMQPDTVSYILLPIIDDDGDSVTVTVTGMPSYVKFDSTFNTLTATPGFLDSGTTPMTVTLSDGALFTDYIINSVINTPPAFDFLFGAPIELVSFFNLVYNFPTITDSESDLVTISIIDIKTGVQPIFVNYINLNETYLTPTTSYPDPITTVQCKIILKDTYPSTMSYDIDIIITKNSPPVILTSVTDVEFTPGKHFKFGPIDFTDPDNHAVTVSARDQGTSSGLTCSFVSFNPSSRTFNMFTTLVSDIGLSCNIEIVGTDTVDSSVYSFKATVRNTLPSFQAPGLTNQQVSQGHSVIYKTPLYFDPDPNHSTSVTSINVGGATFITFMNANPITFNFQPSLSDADGDYLITIVLSDTYWSPTYTFILSVLQNQPPNFTDDLIDTLTVYSDTPFTYPLPSILDAEGDTVSIVASLSNPLFVTISLTEISVSPSTADIGEHEISFELSDTFSTMSFSISLTVIQSKPPVKINMHAPYFKSQETFEDITIRVGQIQNVEIPPIIDEDGEAYKMSILNFTQSGLFKICSLQGQQMRFAPNQNEQAGTYTVTIELKDKNVRPITTLYSFKVCVLPKITIPNIPDLPFEELERLSPQDIFSVEEGVLSKKKVSFPDMRILDKLKQSTVLKAEITKITNNGLVTISFNHDIRVPNFYNQFNQSILEVSILTYQQKQQSQFQRILQVELSSISTTQRTLYANKFDQTEQVLKVNEDYNWTISQFTQKRLLMNLQFLRPLDISREETHYLQIKFVQNGLFIERSNNKAIELNYTASSKMPRQIAYDRLSQMLIDNKDKIQSVMTASMNANILSNVALSQTLQYLWGLINALQIVVRMPLMSLSFPANVQILFSIIIDVTNFSFFSTSDVEGKILTFTETGSYNLNFEAMGYESTNIIENMGPMFWYLPMIGFIHLGLYVIKLFTRLCQVGERFHKFLENKIVYGLILRFYLESYLEMAISAFLHLKNVIDLFSMIFLQIQWHTGGDKFSGISSGFLAITIIAYPLGMIIMIKKRYDQIQIPDSPYNQRFGTLFFGLKTNSHGALLFNFYFMMRRLVFVIATHFLTDHPMIQVNLLFFQCLFMILYLIHYQPFVIKSLNYLEIFNETTILSLTYQTILLTGYLDATPEFQFQVGWCIISIILFNVLVNFLIVLYETLKALFYLLSKFYNKYLKKYCIAQSDQLTQDNFVVNTHQLREDSIICQQSQFMLLSGGSQTFQNISQMQKQKKKGKVRKEPIQIQTRVPVSIATTTLEATLELQNSNLMLNGSMSKQQKPKRRKKALQKNQQNPCNNNESGIVKDNKFAIFTDFLQQHKQQTQSAVPAPVQNQYCYSFDKSTDEIQEQDDIHQPQSNPYQNMNSQKNHILSMNQDQTKQKNKWQPIPYAQASFYNNTVIAEDNISSTHTSPERTRSNSEIGSTLITAPNMNNQWIIQGKEIEESKESIIDDNDPQMFIPGMKRRKLLEKLQNDSQLASEHHAKGV